MAVATSVTDIGAKYKAGCWRRYGASWTAGRAANTAEAAKKEETIHATPSCRAWLGPRMITSMMKTAVMKISMIGAVAHQTFFAGKL